MSNTRQQWNASQNWQGINHEVQYQLRHSPTKISTQERTKANTPLVRTPFKRKYNTPLPVLLWWASHYPSIRNKSNKRNKRNNNSHLFGTFILGTSSNGRGTHPLLVDILISNHRITIGTPCIPYPQNSTISRLSPAIPSHPSRIAPEITIPPDAIPKERKERIKRKETRIGSAYEKQTSHMRSIGYIREVKVTRMYNLWIPPRKPMV